MSKEIEYKWQAGSIRDYKLFLQLAEYLGAKVSKLKKIQIKDQYLDTPEKFFQKSHLECRMRQTNGHSELTLKSLSGSDREIFIRDEKTVKLPHFTSKKSALAYCQNNFFKKIQPLFDVLNDRQINTLILPCGTRAEANFDHVLMSRGEKKVPMREIELEFKSGKVKNFKAFVKKLSTLSLTPSQCSKFEVGMKHLLKDSLQNPVDSPDELFNEILKVNIEILMENGASILAGHDPEAIHDMRVATRRLRAAILTFKSMIPTKTKKIRLKLQKLFRTLGRKRDQDVFYEFILNTIKAKSISLPKLDRKMERSQKQMIAMLKSKFYVDLIGSLKQLKTITTKTNRDILKLARNRIQRALNRVLKIAPSISLAVDDAILHKLRISVKKLRYISEFFEPVFKKYVCPLEPLIEKTKKLQDILGDHQDAIAGVSMLKRHKNEFSATVFKQLKRAYELKKMTTLKSFFNALKNFWIGTGFHRQKPASAIELIFFKQGTQ